MLLFELHAYLMESSNTALWSCHVELELNVSLSVSSVEISACLYVIVSCWGTGNGGVSAACCCFSVSAWPPVWQSFCSIDLLLSLRITHHIIALIYQGANWSVLRSVNCFPYWHLILTFTQCWISAWQTVCWQTVF